MWRRLPVFGGNRGSVGQPAGTVSVWEPIVSLDLLLVSSISFWFPEAVPSCLHHETIPRFVILLYPCDVVNRPLIRYS